jgi:hypothetical protein
VIAEILSLVLTTTIAERDEEIAITIPDES